MTPTQLQSLISRRDEIASHAAKLAATPISERPTKPAELKAWLRDLEELQALAKQLDSLVKRATAKQRVTVCGSAAAPDSGGGDVVTVARIPKGRRAEMRVSVKPWKGRQVIDIRLWSLLDGSGEEMRPSRKGIAFDSANLDALINALHQAKQYV